MKRVVGMLSVVGLLVACAPGAESGSPDIAVKPTKVLEVAFTCSQGESLSVRFFPDQGVAVLVRNGDTIELQQQPSASGFIYSNGPNTIRGKGDDLTVELGRRVPIQCRAAG
jgi:membrane-bound inhibitor of C-type lysozyme